MAIEFKATLLSNDSRYPNATIIYTTPNVTEQLGTRARISIKGKINQTTFTGSLFPTGQGTHYMVINKKLREAAGLKSGDTVLLAIEVDTAPRRPVVPADLEKALANFPQAKRRFEILSPSHQKEYATYVDEAKKEETKKRRIAKVIDMLSRSESEYNE